MFYLYFHGMDEAVPVKLPTHAGYQKSDTKKQLGRNKQFQLPYTTYFVDCWKPIDRSES